MCFYQFLVIDDLADIEITYFVYSTVDENICAFEISVQNSVGMEDVKSFHQMVYNFPDLGLGNERVSLFLCGYLLIEISTVCIGGNIPASSMTMQRSLRF